MESLEETEQDVGRLEEIQNDVSRLPSSENREGFENTPENIKIELKGLERTKENSCSNPKICKISRVK